MNLPYYFKQVFGSPHSIRKEKSTIYIFTPFLGMCELFTLRYYLSQFSESDDF